LSNFYLRKGFEVCGILEDVYVARKRNKLGQPYGFVRFSNVRDISKLSKALNAVCFGEFCVRARLARFDRYDGSYRESEGGDATTGVKTKELGTRAVDVPQKVMEQPRIAAPELKPLGVTDSQEGVTVGEVLVRLGNRREKEEGTAAPAHGDALKVPNALVEEQYSRVYVRSYKADPEDVDWARCGVVATVANGEAPSVLRRRLEDAGFKELDLTHLGGDQVLVRSVEGVDVMAVFDSAKDFFQLCFSHWVRWENEAIPYRRGAWVRIYGIPLHAWNVLFFKLCVMDCGRFLRPNSYTAAKDRLDFARVLIATQELAVIKKVEQLLVDGSLVEV
jgi:hypothetical protein